MGYDDGGRAGSATDFYFGFRLGRLGKPFYFVPKYTAKVRLTGQSQSRGKGADNAFRSLNILLEDLKPEQFTPEIEKSLSDRVRGAVPEQQPGGRRR